MGLLEEIQRDAVDSKSDLGSVLRKCKILAARLGSQPLEDWLIWESNGYPEETPLPRYRILQLNLMGHFTGSYGREIRNAPIPLICLPDDVQERFASFQCRQSVASIESLTSRDEKGTLRLPMGNLAVLLGDQVYSGHSCVDAWGQIGTAGLVEVLNSVRNKVLDFALALWKEEPQAGDSVANAPAHLGGSKVTQIFNTVVHGGTATLVGSAMNSSLVFNIQSGDFSSLEKYLRDAKIADRDIERLRQAVQLDVAPRTAEKFGPRVSSWIGAMVRKAADGGWDVSVSAAGGLLATAIAKYYGI